MDRVIVHVDMDAFYASCEELRHPELRGRPLIVGASPDRGRGRGVVVAANYPARRLGVRAAMGVREAWARAPQAAFLPPDHGFYAELGRRVFEELRVDFELDRVSIDEAFLDATGRTDFDGAPELARRLHDRVAHASGGLSCSVGVGPNRLVAKVATGRGKPNGTTTVPPAAVQAFLDPLPAAELPFIGPRTSRRLETLGIRTVRDLRERGREELMRIFGAHGAHMSEAALGRDDAPVYGGRRTGRSVSHERTFEEDTRDAHRLLRTLRRMMDDLDRELDESGSWYRTVALKVRFGDFTTRTRQRSLPHPVRDTDEARRFVSRLLRPILADPREVRLIGLRLGGLSAGQRTLEDFAHQECGSPDRRPPKVYI